MSCPICLDDLTTPVCPPCGHIQCEECLLAYIASQMNANISPTAIPCPSCKSAFSITSLDEKWIPRKFHQLMHPTIRRVYLPDEFEAKEKIKTLERALSNAKSDKEAATVLCNRKAKQCDDLASRNAELLATINDLKRHIDAMTFATQHTTVSMRNVQTMMTQVTHNLQVEKQNHLATLLRERNQEAQMSELRAIITQLQQSIQGTTDYSQDGTFQQDSGSSLPYPQEVQPTDTEFSDGFTAFSQTNFDQPQFDIFHPAFGQ